MIKNALITAGIENAKVKASAPFKVSGTAALTGILKGFENSSSGKKIDENKKEAANEELVTTGGIGEKIGQNDATNLMNNIKKEVIKEKPGTEQEINKIVDKATEQYKSNLSEEDIANIKAVMKKINNLDLNYNNLKDQLDDITKQLKDKLSTEEAKGFFAKLEEMFSELLATVKEAFSK
jgi:Predicted secreted protein